MPALCDALNRALQHTDSGSDLGDSNALCIIRDMTNTEWQSSKVSLTFPVATTGQQLLQTVAKWCHYEIGTFELILQRMPDGESIVVNDHPKSTLTDMGFRCGSYKRNNLIIGEKNGSSPNKIEVDDDDEIVSGDKRPVSSDDSCTGISANPAAESNDADKRNNSIGPFGSELQTRSFDDADNDGNSSIISSFSKHDTGFVGLVNQAMTCYLNSLLQTLYMTPEFRNALYRWEYAGDEDDKQKNIPFQLQSLFLKLQTSKRHAVETTRLTKSFGWDSSEAWQQHDVQELCRVMFDALEQTFHNTDQSNLINHLYQGKLQDYVKCLQCGYESAREDTYLDIPLPVRPFDSSQAYGSVEEALQAFVHPEVLSGSNQYFCEKCGKKCDAHKGLKFTTFPYLLTLQLKRFDFDYSTLHRIKLNDKVTFPEVLNINRFINREKEEANHNSEFTDDNTMLCEIIVEKRNHLSETEDVPTTLLATHEHEDNDNESSSPLSDGCNEVTMNEKNLHNFFEEGPYVYELFSIMVHSGSANGGHYYAYIKSFQDGQWYCFNDQNVAKITYDDIRKTYGGGPSRSYYSASYSSSTNAYMLMYRQIDKERNAEVMKEDNFPVHIQTLKKAMQDQEDQERQKHATEHTMCKIKLFWNNPILHRVSETILKIPKDTTLREATQTAHMTLGLESKVPLSNCRLVKYDDVNDSLECSFEGREDKPIGELLEGTKSSYKYSLLLEVWPPDKPAPVYRPGGTTVKVYSVNLDTEEVDAPVIVRSSLDATIDDFKGQIIEELRMQSDNPYVVLERYYNDLKPLVGPTDTLKIVGFSRSNKVFVERWKKTNLDEAQRKLAFKNILDRYVNTITLYVDLPEDVNGNNDVDKSVRNGDTESVAEIPFINVLEESCHNRDDSYIHNANCYQKKNKTERLSAHLNGGYQAMDLSNNEATFTSMDSTSGCDNCETPEENMREYIKQQDSSYDWEEGEKELSGHKTQNLKKFLSALPYRDSLTNSKMLQIKVDKRITIAELKKQLERHVGVPTASFKVYRVYSNGQEGECTRLNENLVACTDDSKLIVRVGRALREGEYRVKIFELLLNEPEPSQFLFEWILVKGTTVLQAKKAIIKEMKTKCNLDIPLERCRLRIKSWKTPSSILFNEQKFGEDISNVFDNSEMYVEHLPDIEKVVSSSQISLYIKWWHPSTFVLDPMVELVLEDYSMDSFKNKLSAMSGIPPQYLDFAKVQGSFPYKISLLTLQTDLTWNPRVTHLNRWPLYICDDGFVVVFKDRREVQKCLTDEERKDIITKENIRFHKTNHTAYSRQEKALKIYMDHHPKTADV